VPRYNIPPTQDVPIIRQADGKRYMSIVRWRLIPSWTKDFKKAPMLNNARAETVAEKPSFRTPFKKQRSIIPVSGFYEWQPYSSGQIRERGSRIRVRSACSR
jgi:putative SOS response-associated peptidase YedK